MSANDKLAATYHPYATAEEAAIARRRDQYAAQLTGEPAYTYRHAGPVTQRAIDLLIQATWDRETLAVEIQNWQDQQWHVPLSTKQPQPSTYSLADHLLSAQNGNRP